MDSFALSWPVLGTAALVLAVIFLVRNLPKIIAGVPFVAPAEVARRAAEEGEDQVIIDVRTPAEHAVGHPEGAINMPVTELRDRLIALPRAELAQLKAVPVYLICLSDSRAAGAASLLKKVGFSRLGVIAGGVKAWTKAGLPYARS